MFMYVCYSFFVSLNGFGGLMEVVYEKNGLMELGEEFICELNCLGIMVDLLYVLDMMMKQVIVLSKVLVVWIYFGLWMMWDYFWNVLDDVFELIGDGFGKNVGVVQLVFFLLFIGFVDVVNVLRVVDYIEYIVGIVGRKYVGIGLDFDGMYLFVEGLEDVSKYLNLVSFFL